MYVLNRVLHFLTGYVSLPIPDLRGSPGMVGCCLLKDLRTTPHSPSIPMFRAIPHDLNLNSTAIAQKLYYPEERKMGQE